MIEDVSEERRHVDLEPIKGRGPKGSSDFVRYVKYFRDMCSSITVPMSSAGVKCQSLLGFFCTVLKT